MTEDYIRGNFEKIRSHANAIEERLDDSGLNMEDLIQDNKKIFEACREEECILLQDTYPENLEELL